MIKGKKIMAPKYTRDETISELKEALKTPETLYDADCINWTGYTSDTKEPYTEIIADYLLAHKDLWGKTKTISRETSYDVKHEKVPDGAFKPIKGTKTEKWIAKSMFDNNYDFIGKVIDYETPLRNTSEDKCGEIDLLALSQDSTSLYLIELKKADNPETLLRCVLEIYTYSQIVDSEKLRSSFAEKGVKKDTKIRPIVAVFKGSKQHDALKKDSSLVNRLRVELGIGAVVLTANEKVEPGYNGYVAKVEETFNIDG
jgi:hypothetical protein